MTPRPIKPAIPTYQDGSDGRHRGWMHRAMIRHERKQGRSPEARMAISVFLLGAATMLYLGHTLIALFLSLGASWVFGWTWGDE